MTDFIKANVGIFILVLLFLLLFGTSVFTYITNQHPSAGDYTSWVEQKAGELLAAILTAIVGSRTADKRSTDIPKAVNGNGNGNANVSGSGH